MAVDEELQVILNTHGACGLWIVLLPHFEKLLENIGVEDKLVEASLFLVAFDGHRQEDPVGDLFVDKDHNEDEDQSEAEQSLV